MKLMSWLIYITFTYDVCRSRIIMLVTSITTLKVRCNYRGIIERRPSNTGRFLFSPPFSPTKFFDGACKSLIIRRKQPACRWKRSLQRAKKRGQSLLMLDYLLEDPVNLKSRERAYSIYYAFRVWNNCVRSGVLQRSLRIKPQLFLDT